MIGLYEWHLVAPQRRKKKWHLWSTGVGISFCGYADRQVQTLVRPVPRGRFRVCQMCRRHAERKKLKLPRWAITPNRKRATP